MGVISRPTALGEGVGGWAPALLHGCPIFWAWLKGAGHSSKESIWRACDHCAQGGGREMNGTALKSISYGNISHIRRLSKCPNGALTVKHAHTTKKGLQIVFWNFLMCDLYISVICQLPYPFPLK